MGKWLRGLLWTAGILGVIGLIGRALVFDVWTLPDEAGFGAALAPTLRPGDMVLLLKRGQPGFGDLVRCTDPQDPKLFVVGRIAGLPRDHIEIEGASLSVNGHPYNAESACPDRRYTIAHPTSGEVIDLACEEVTMGPGWHFRGHSKKPLFGALKTTADVGEDMVYLLSDDRDYHDDSRDFGAVPRSTCKERVVFRLWGKQGMKDDPWRFEVIR
jgi:signal peptidase I